MVYDLFVDGSFGMYAKDAKVCVFVEYFHITVIPVYEWFESCQKWLSEIIFPVDLVTCKEHRIVSSPILKSGV